MEIKGNSIEGVSRRLSITSISHDKVRVQIEDSNGVAITHVNVDIHILLPELRVMNWRFAGTLYASHATQER